MALELEVRQDERRCIFWLTWGNGQRLSAELPYPESLTQSYQSWQETYLNFYRRLGSKLPDTPFRQQRPTSELRGRGEESGSLPSPEDWRFKLVEAESHLRAEFYRWLHSGQLIEIRRQIAQVTKAQSEAAIQEPNRHDYVDLFLTCSPIELERLPWEAWEIGTEFATTTTIRIARTSAKIRQIAQGQSRQHVPPRILVIVGKDTSLSFQAEREAILAKSRVAEIHFTGWQPGQDLTNLFDRIKQAITDARGWDGLIFLGHSNEAADVGGELVIAPNMSISVSEIAKSLQIAKEQGLQFALFNSCKGLDIATSLIDLGLSQVVVMREPIHNQVAQEFLVQFLQGLVEYKDIHESLLLACQFLKTKRDQTYPSADLVPSLFRHPGGTHFRIKPVGLRAWLMQWWPTRRQAIALSTIVLLSLLPQVQGFLLDKRVLLQAGYRYGTGQYSRSVHPQVLLVQIDEDSIRKAEKSKEISNRWPMDYNYLARLIDRLSALNARVIGVDYLLDQPKGGSEKRIAKSIRAAVARKPQGSWFVFANDLEKERMALPEIANPNWSLHGDWIIRMPYMNLVSPAETPSLPFAYLLDLAYQLNSKPLQPSLLSQTDFQSQLGNDMRGGQNITNLFPSQSQKQLITQLSYRLRQMWLHPVIDFSLPPGQVYDSIPASQLLENSLDSSQRQLLEQQVVLIIPGVYSEAGATSPGKEEDIFRSTAVWFWRTLAEEDPNARLKPLTGGEIHAYMLNQLLTQRLVVPIPDLWMIGVAALLGQGTVLALREHSSHQRKWVALMVSATAAYGLVGLQIYLSAAVLLPWLLPSLTFWTYVLPALRRIHV